MARAGDQVGLGIYHAVLQAVANEEPTPAEGVQVTRILEAQARVVAFQFGAPWQPNTKAIVERLVQMSEEAAARPEEAA
jgi:hypothetical protein